VSGPLVDIGQLTSDWRAVLAVNSPLLGVSRFYDHAEGLAQAVLAQAAPDTWRSIGEAFLLELHLTMATWRRPIGWEQLLRARVALRLIDAAFDRAVHAPPGVSP